jgi:hypothetical protein
MTYVLLINREVGLAHNSYPVCGKSTKCYGAAAPDFARGGVAFRMSIEDYERDKWDILGNRNFQQIWVPEFVVEQDPLTGMKYNDLCKLAQEKGVLYHFGMKKPELVEALRKAA